MNAPAKLYCFCGDCSSRIITCSPLEGNIRSLALFEGPVRNSVHKLKYERCRWISLHLAGWMSDYLDKDTDIGFDAIIPVPLHWKRELRRTFNQSALIAFQLGRLRKKPVLLNSLKKIRNNLSQTGLDKEERKENVRNAYRFAGRSRIAGMDILVVDDVYTTGATVEEVYRTLKKAGAGKISVLTVART